MKREEERRKRFVPRNVLASFPIHRKSHETPTERLHSFHRVRSFSFIGQRVTGVHEASHHRAGADAPPRCGAAASAFSRCSVARLRPSPARAPTPVPMWRGRGLCPSKARPGGLRPFPVRRDTVPPLPSEGVARRKLRPSPARHDAAPPLFDAARRGRLRPFQCGTARRGSAPPPRRARRTWPPPPPPPRASRRSRARRSCCPWPPPRSGRTRHPT